MSLRGGEFEQIRTVVAEADADEPLTASEILRLLEARGEEFDSAHRVATILGRKAGEEVEVIEDTPYRYRFPGLEH